MVLLAFGPPVLLLTQSVTADPVDVRHDTPLDAVADVAPDPLAQSRQLLFVNFDGAVITAGNDDARTNTSSLARSFSRLVGEFPAYGTGARRFSVLQAMELDWAPFNVHITQTRPASGNYTMVVVGPREFADTQGYAPIDCANTNPNNIAFVNSYDGDRVLDTNQTAGLLGHEAAHSFGLEHTEDGDQMMESFITGDPSFVDSCLPHELGYTQCSLQHAAHCESGSNEYQEAMTLFGPREADTVAPVVEIVAPANGSTFDENDSFQIEATAIDDVDIAEVRLENDGTYIAQAKLAPYAWNVENAPPGQYTFVAIAADRAGNETRSQAITVNIAPGDDSPGDDDEGSGETEDGTGDPGGSTAGGDDGTGTDVDTVGPDGPAGDDIGASGGCSCRSTGGYGTGAGFFSALALLSFRSRRRAPGLG